MLKYITFQTLTVRENAPRGKAEHGVFFSFFTPCPPIRRKHNV